MKGYSLTIRFHSNIRAHGHFSNISQFIYFFIEREYRKETPWVYVIKILGTRTRKPTNYFDFS